MYEKLPPELIAQNAWVNVWNASKIPMQTRIRKGASSVSPSTWGTFEQAVKNVENGVYDGLGYVFHDTGIIGIDIDDGRDADGFLSRLAIDIICHCRSYTEWSRSGRGVHIIVRGKIPFKGRNNHAGVEMYKSSRYFIMTGKAIGFREIVENQEALDYIVDTYFPDAMKVEDAVAPRIYTPIYHKPEQGKVKLRPEYPEIPAGSRNICLTSLAGQLHSQGYSKAEIYKELLYANESACRPTLPRSEIESIVNSVIRYKR